jgi:hypothetical protein
MRCKYKASDFFVEGDLVVLRDVPENSCLDTTYAGLSFTKPIKIVGFSSSGNCIIVRLNNNINTSFWAERFALCKPDGTIIEEFPYHFWLKD